MGKFDIDNTLGSDAGSVLDPLLRSSLDLMLNESDTLDPPPSLVAPCAGWERLVATLDLEDLSLDERDALMAHLAACDSCRSARLMYLIVDELFVRSASESLSDALDALSPIALAALGARLRAEASLQDDSPLFSPELLKVWGAEALRMIPPELLASWDREAPCSLPPELQALMDDEEQAAEAQKPAANDVPSEPHSSLFSQIFMSSPAHESPSPVPRIRSALDVPDDAQTHTDPTYSPVMAQLLTEAYVAIKQGRYTHAMRLAQNHINGSMAARQRMRKFYVLALASSAVSAYQDAMNWLDEAEDIACDLGDVGALAELAYHSGVVNGAVQNCGAAAEYFDIALDSIHTLSEEGEPVDPSFELHTLTLLAHYLFVLGKYELVTDHIAEARRLVQLVPESQLQAASIEWLAALLYRWSGQPDRALRYALAAAKVYSDFAPGAGTVHDAKLRSVVAECALDIAESLAANEQPDQCQVFVRLARPYVQQSLAIARNTLSASDAESEAVTGLLLLTSFRFERLAGERENHTAKYEQIERVGRKIGDSSLLCQTYTALGQEMAWRGERESSLYCYRRAVDAQSRGDAVVWGVWARRGLLLDAEMHVS